MKVVMISGSRSGEGQTGRAAEAALEGAAGEGAEVERVLLPLLRIERCRQCRDDGWGTCLSDGACCIDDDLASVVEAIQEADAIICATPVYYSDLSESLRALLDRIRRQTTHESFRGVVAGKQVLGICVAGGGGGGAPACCVSMEHALTTSGFSVEDVMAVRRQNLERKLGSLKEAGAALVRMVHD